MGQSHSLNIPPTSVDERQREKEELLREAQQKPFNQMIKASIILMGLMETTCHSNSTCAMFLPKTFNLNLIRREQQTHPNGAGGGGGL